MTVGKKRIPAWALLASLVVIGAVGTLGVLHFGDIFKTTVASGASQRFPDDVRSFVDHAADCADLVKKRMDAFGLGEAECFRLEAERDRLIGRHRNQPEIVAALKAVPIPPAIR